MLAPFGPPTIKSLATALSTQALDKIITNFYYY